MLRFRSFKVEDGFTDYNFNSMSGGKCNIPIAKYIAIVLSLKAAHDNPSSNQSINIAMVPYIKQNQAFKLFFDIDTITPRFRSMRTDFLLYDPILSFMITWQMMSCILSKQIEYKGIVM